MQLNSSISELPVIFKRIIRTHTTDPSQRIHYKVLAEVSTDTGPEKRAYWFSARNAFLRQRNQATGRTSLKVGCSANQRAQIRALVKTYAAAQQ